MERLTAAIAVVVAATNPPRRVVSTQPHRRTNVAAAVWGTDNKQFNVYKSILRHPNLFFQFAIRLPYTTMIDLYAIDKEFHFRLNQYSVGLINDFSSYHAPIASKVFSWNLYPALCISDPMLRPMDNRSWLARDVPGFRWVGMVLWRQMVVRSILTLLALEGHYVPEAAESALAKFWVLMERPNPRAREAFLSNPEVWSNEEIVAMHCVRVKLEMRFSHPISGLGARTLAHLLLTQKSLSMLWEVLNGQRTLDYDDTLELVVRTYVMEDLDTEAAPWLQEEDDTGVPEEEEGLLCREGWTITGEPMKPVLDLMAAEGLKRGLHYQRHILDCALYGTVDKNPRENVPVPRLFRKQKTFTEPEKGWPPSQDTAKVNAALFATWMKRQAVKAEEGNGELGEAAMDLSE